jgi:hypothetical protein
MIQANSPSPAISTMIHLVYLVHRGPNFTHFMINKMSDQHKANLPAVSHKENMTIDKENIHSNAKLFARAGVAP